MWPWGHLAIGYVCYRLAAWLFIRWPPTFAIILTLGLATQFPDMVDKPLAYLTPILPEGRAFAHSLLVAVPLCFLVAVVAIRRDSIEIGSAFIVGYLSHLLGDSYQALLAGRFDAVSFLAWPVLSAPDYATQSFIGHWDKLISSINTISLAEVATGGLPTVIYQGLLAIAVIFLWVGEGTPGLRNTE